LQEVQSHGDVCIAGIATISFSVEGLGHILLCMFGQIFLQEPENGRRRSRRQEFSERLLKSFRFCDPLANYEGLNLQSKQ
jgi:hypothetical protein